MVWSSVGVVDAIELQDRDRSDAHVEFMLSPLLLVSVRSRGRGLGGVECIARVLCDCYHAEMPMFVCVNRQRDPKTFNDTRMITIVTITTEAGTTTITLEVRLVLHQEGRVE